MHYAEIIDYFRKKNFSYEKTGGKQVISYQFRLFVTTVASILILEQTKKKEISKLNTTRFKLINPYHFIK